MTRHSLVVAAQSNDPATRSWGIEGIAAAYWRPVYKYVRMKWNIAPEDAADFTQEFFTRLLEKESLDSYDSGKGSLRTFLRTCADHLFMNQARDSKRLKRGVGSKLYSKDVLVQIFIAKLTVWIVLLTELDKVGHLLVNSLEFRR
jgi:DNA-directed RNA polymerase specialized sigma24 family protein